MSKIIFNYGKRDFEYNKEVIQNLLGTIYSIEACLFKKDLQKNIIVEYIHQQAPRCLAEDFSNNTSQRILLSSEDNYWGQYAYQFSHELCHLNIGSEKTYFKPEYKFSFFEEAVCWLCSIWVLDILTKYNGDMHSALINYKQSFSNYKNMTLNEVPQQPQDFSSWFCENWNLLQHDFCCNFEDNNSRQRASIVAMALSRFAGCPEFWESCAYITTKDSIILSKDAGQFFDTWRASCPQIYREVVQSVRALFPS